MSTELKEQVRQALKEIKRDEYHAQVHQKAASLMSRKLRPGETGQVRCGLCEDIITMTMPKEIEIT